MLIIISCKKLFNIDGGRMSFNLNFKFSLLSSSTSKQFWKNFTHFLRIWTEWTVTTYFVENISQAYLNKTHCLLKLRNGSNCVEFNKAIYQLLANSGETDFFTVSSHHCVRLLEIWKWSWSFLLFKSFLILLI